MSYTHYWENDHDSPLWRAAWPMILLDAHRIVEAAAGLGVAVRGFDGTGEPVIGPDRIILNGDREAGNDYEPFGIYGDGSRLRGDVDYGTEWVSTNLRPYDLVVTAILLRAHHHAGSAFRIRSDGTWEEWGVPYPTGLGVGGVSPRSFVESVFGEVPLNNPLAGSF